MKVYGVKNLMLLAALETALLGGSSFIIHLAFVFMNAALTRQMGLNLKGVNGGTT